MTQSHTPAPWIIDAKYPSEVQTEKLETIATCWHENANGKEITVVGVLECSLAESRANARLIAAAPELLEALENLCGMLKRNGYATDFADKALAKARG